jgi:hypothetical protein
MLHDLLSENVTYVFLACSSASQRCSLSWVPPFDDVHVWVLYSRFALRAFPPSILLRSSFPGFLFSVVQGTSPYKVVTRINDVVYRIQRNPRSRMMVVHLDRLASYQGPARDELP